jgi:hypothetical protein
MLKHPFLKPESGRSGPPPRLTPESFTDCQHHHRNPPHRKTSPAMPPCAKLTTQKLSDKGRADRLFED